MIWVCELALFVCMGVDKSNQTNHLSIKFFEYAFNVGLTSFCAIFKGVTTNDVTYNLVEWTGWTSRQN